MFISSDDNTEAIGQLIRETDKLDCAVAFLGKKAEDILRKFSKAGCRCRCICNLSSGGTNPYAVETLMKTEIEIKNHPSLHAKVYIGEDYGIVSSANLSANGLGLEADELNGWIEAGYKVTDTKELSQMREWFNDLWNNKAEKIKKKDIENAKNAWNRRRIARPRPAIAIGERSNSLLKELKDNPSALLDRNIYLAIYREQYGPEAKEKLQNIKKSYPINICAYEGWDNLPENSFFLDIYVGPKGGFWLYYLKSPDKRILVPFQYKDGTEGNLFLFFNIDNILGYKVDQEDRELLREKATEILSESNTDDKYIYDDGRCIPIMNARSILFPNE